MTDKTIEEILESPLAEMCEAYSSGVFTDSMNAQIVVAASELIKKTGGAELQTGLYQHPLMKRAAGKVGVALVPPKSKRKASQTTDDSTAS